MESGIYIGIDLCDDFSQVCYYKKNMENEEPVSVDFTGLERQYQLPTAISKSIGKDEWYAGDEAVKCARLGEGILIENLLAKAVLTAPYTVDDQTVMPIDLIKKYLEYLIQAAKVNSQSEEVEKICVTVMKFNISILNVISKALIELGYDKERFILTSHKESFIYYALNQKEELHKNEVVLFDYGYTGLMIHRMYTLVERGSKVTTIASEDYTKEIKYELSENTNSIEFLDNLMKETAVKTMDKKNISSVFLVGNGFSDDLKLPDFIKYICDRRKVFAGQNLYVKGACYQCLDGVNNNTSKEYLIACDERITTGIEMKISDFGKDKILRMVRPGVNWYNAGVSYDFIIDDIDSLELFLSPVGTVDKQLINIPITEFPDRPNKTTRIKITLDFMSASRCHVSIKDMGFGEFFQSSKRVINEEILI